MLIKFINGFRDAWVELVESLPRPNANQVGWVSGWSSIVILFFGGLIWGGFKFLDATVTVPPTPPKKSPFPVASAEIEWERFSGNIGYDVFRQPVPEGWLVLYNGHIVYVPDNQHAWTINK